MANTDKTKEELKAPEAPAKETPAPETPAPEVPTKETPTKEAPTKETQGEAETPEARRERILQEREAQRAYLDEKVEVELFHDSGKYSSDVFVAVNGKGYQIKRGVKVQVPRSVALVLQASKDQDNATAELIDGLTSDFAQKAQSLGV